MSKPSKKKQNSANLKKERIHKLINMAIGFHRQGQVKLAEEAYRKAIEADPLNFRALYLLGVLFSEAGNHKDGSEFLRMAIQVNPGYSPAYNDLGVMLQQLGDTKGATEAYEQALELNANFAEAQNNLGVTYGARGNATKARECFKKASELNPIYYDSACNHIFALDLAKEQTVQSLIDVRKQWSKTFEEPLLKKHKPHTNELTTDRKLRVGYVSADLRLHSASFVFGAMLEFYNKEKFEVYCYNNSNAIPDDRMKFFKSSVTEWRDVFGMSDDDLATKIRQDKIDILVDLSGYSAGSRLLVFARKPSPVQVTAWGYATSTCMRSMDYFLADEVVVPPEERDLYVEDVVYLPCLVNHYSPEQFPATVESPCITTNIVTFGSFNRAAKISDETYEAWAKILKEVPNSRLMISINENDYKTTQARIVEIFAGHGIPGTRLFFRGRVGWTDFMNGYNHIDVILDSWPHSGGLSCIDALKMSVPLVTYKHPTIVGRLSASILHTVGLDELITNTIDDYIQLAVDLAKDTERLKELRTKIRLMLDASIIGDCKRYVKVVEDEYLKMWEKHVTEARSS